MDQQSEIDSIDSFIKIVQSFENWEYACGYRHPSGSFIICSNSDVHLQFMVKLEELQDWNENLDLLASLKIDSASIMISADIKELMKCVKDNPLYACTYNYLREACDVCPVEEYRSISLPETDETK
jgi:hypothetical protein